MQSSTEIDLRGPLPASASMWRGLTRTKWLEVGSFLSESVESAALYIRLGWSPSKGKTWAVTHTTQRLVRAGYFFRDDRITDDEADDFRSALAGLFRRIAP